jgi:hypothetical protein
MLPLSPKIFNGFSSSHFREERKLIRVADRNEFFNRLPDHFFGGVPKDSFRRLVPRRNRAVQLMSDYRFSRQSKNACYLRQKLVRIFGFLGHYASLLKVKHIPWQVNFFVLREVVEIGANLMRFGLS